MLPPEVRLFNPAGPDRVAAVSAEPAYGRAGAFLVRVARGPRSGMLTAGGTYGPYGEAEVAEPFAQLVGQLYAEGYLPSGAHSALVGLQSSSAEERGRAAARLGWIGGPGAVEALLGALPEAVDEVCAILDALGMLADPRAAEAVRPYAARKLLSRRRSAVEALRNMGDAVGLSEARQRTLEQLPEGVREALLRIEEVRDLPVGEATARLTAAAQEVDAQRRGLVADLLYERAGPPAVAAATAVLDGLAFNQPFNWRYVKSVLKRAMLRGDFRTFGWLMHAIESRGRDLHGTSAVVKSGYDGAERKTVIFGRRTRDYVRRAGWRYLRRLAAHRPEFYTLAAAEAVVFYTDEDAEPATKKYGAFAGCYLLHRVLWGGSPRYEFVGRSMKYKVRGAKHVKPVAGAREEAYPHLWDAQPRPYLRVLSAAKLVDAQEFAYAGVARHPSVMKEATADELAGMLDAPYEPTVAIATAEIVRRLDPADPDWALVERVAGDARPQVGELGRKFLRENVGLWASDVNRVVRLLTSAAGETRVLVAELVIPVLLGDAGAAARAPLAQRLWTILKLPEPFPGLHEGLARVCREALAEELSAAVPGEELLFVIAEGSPAAQAVAGDLLGRRPGAVAALGLERVTALAQHPLAAVRGAGQALVRAAVDYWSADPSVLLALAESEWPDTRAAALDLLRKHLDFVRLGTPALMGLLDSNRPDVQAAAIEMAKFHFDRLDAKELLRRLAEHPHPTMRRFALELATKHLGEGAEALAAAEPVFRAALLDLWPKRREKDQVIALLLERGLKDEAQAAAAARVLEEAVRFQARADFEPALEALVRLRLAYPAVGKAVGLPPELMGGEA